MASLSRRMRRPVLVLVASLIALTVSCSSQKQAKRELTERERNEAIARSPLPGASVVGRALAVSDRSERRAESLDSLGH